MVNAALTQRLTDSADAVLGLTSSASMGQMQELDELGRQLHRGMPLLPAVTRSGRHDEGEIDGDIRKLLHNRRAESRADQEADVRVRTRHEHLGMGVDQRCSESRCRSLRTWRVSGVRRQVRCVTRDLSRCTRRCSRSPAGGRYDACMRAEVGLHHLDENVLGLPVRDVLLLLNELQASALLTSNWPERRREQLTDALWRNVVPKLPALLDAYTATGDAGAVCRALPRPVFDGFACVVKLRLADCVVMQGQRSRGSTWTTRPGLRT